MNTKTKIIGQNYHLFLKFLFILNCSYFNLRFITDQLTIQYLQRENFDIVHFQVSIVPGRVPRCLVFPEVQHGFTASVPPGFVRDIISKIMNTSRAKTKRYVELENEATVRFLTIFFIILPHICPLLIALSIQYTMISR